MSQTPAAQMCTGGGAGREPVSPPLQLWGQEGDTLTQGPLQGSQDLIPVSGGGVTEISSLQNWRL